MTNDSILQPWSPETPAETRDDAPPPSPTGKRVKLKTVGDVSREMAKLYREARNGKIDVSDASKLANMLSILSRILETSDLERRVEKLEGHEVTH
tara:strand:+ start:974 stop:1258 length:285 start_codon:yes stop_codon:yes gene_type:complete